MITAEDTSVDRTFRAVADPTRRRILQLLAVNARTVGSICEQFDLSQPAISQHIRVLREAGLVEAHAEWRHRTYHVKPERLKAVLDWVRHFEVFWDEALDRLDNLIEKETEGTADG